MEEVHARRRAGPDLGREALEQVDPIAVDSAFDAPDIGRPMPREVPPIPRDRWKQRSPRGGGQHLREQDREVRGE